MIRSLAHTDRPRSPKVCWMYTALQSLALFVLLFSLPAAAQELPKIPSGTSLQSSLKSDTYSKSALGYSSAYKLLQQRDDPVRLKAPTTQKLDAKDSVWLIDPSLHHMMSRPQIEVLEHYLSSEATMVVSLPKRYAAQQSLMGQELLKTALLSEGASAAILRLINGYGNMQRDVIAHAQGPWPLAIDLERPQSLHALPDGWDILVGDSDAAFVIRGRRRNGAPLYIVSDSDLFANHRLGHADHALLLETLADATRTAGGTMYIDEAFHGYLQSYTPLQNALRGKGAWLSAATLLFLLLTLWWALMTPRIKWREFRVVRHNTHTLSSRIGRVVSTYRSPVKRVHAFRDLLVQSVLPRPEHTSEQAYNARIQHLEALRQPTHTLNTLDQRLHALSARASKRAARQLLRDYQQWFTEVRDATR